MVRHRRGITLLEVTSSFGLAIVLVTALGARIVSSSRALRVADEERRGARALQIAYDKLRAGLVALPAPGGSVAVPTSGSIVISVERGRERGPRELEQVTLRARWRSADGRARSAELTCFAEAAR